MIQLCDNTISLTLKIIFENISMTSNHPDIWKTANITPVFKKGNKQLVDNHRPISFPYLFCSSTTSVIILR